MQQSRHRVLKLKAGKKKIGQVAIEIEIDDSSFGVGSEV
jgi:hypothetical protein